MIKIFCDSIRLLVISSSGTKLAEFDHRGVSNIAFSDGTAVSFDKDNKCTMVQVGKSFITTEHDTEVIGGIVFMGSDIEWMIFGELIGRVRKVPWL